MIEILLPKCRMTVTQIQQSSNYYHCHWLYSYMYVLFANRGSGQSVDCPAQTVDPHFAQQSMDCLRKLWIHACVTPSQAPQTKRAGRNRIEGLSCIPRRSGGSFLYPNLSLNPKSWDARSLTLNALGWSWDNPWIVCAKLLTHGLCRAIHKLSGSTICALHTCVYTFVV